MCEMQKLRVSVEQILTAAAEEIFGVFKRSIAEIEEKLDDSSQHKKRKQTLQHGDIPIQAEHQDQEDPDPPHIKEEQEEEWISREEEWMSQEEEQTMKLALLSECPTPIQQLWMVKEELPLEQKERNPSLDQVDPEPPQTKAEENLWTNQDGEQFPGLEEADVTEFPSTPPHVKSEYDGDEAQSSQLHHSQTEENTEEPEDGDDYEESEPDSIQNNDLTMSDVASTTTQHQYTQDHETCEVLSTSQTQMTVHTMKEPFRCSVCNKGFAHKGNLKRHMLVHTGEKPFSCTVCMKSFARKSLVTEHMSVHTGEKPFNCSVCNKGFARKSEVNHHMLVHTREKPFLCPFCNKGFGRKFEVKHHMLVHTGEKPFTCTVCKKGFAHKSNLKNHMPVHTGEKPFSCSVCKKGFSHKRNLKKHMVTHTGNL